MLKFGVYNLAQLRAMKSAKTFLGGSRSISITLYDQLKNPEDEKIAEYILNGFSDDRGAYKRTYSKRFEDFDKKIVALVGAHFSKDKPLFMHDVAVSDGRTSCDFFEKLADIFPKLNFYASDYDSEIIILESGTTKVTINTQGKLLEVVWPPFVFNAIKQHSYYPLNNIMFFLVRFFVVRKMMVQYKAGAIKNYRIKLFCPRANVLAKSDERFQLGKYNVLDPFPAAHKLSIVRAMNILNASYFTSAEFERLLRNIWNSLSEGGLLIAGSNQDAATLVHGTVYQKQKDKFHKLWVSGDGLSVDLSILNFKG